MWFVLLGVVLCIGAAFAIPQVRFLFFGLPEDRLAGQPVETGGEGEAEASVADVEQALRDAGLGSTPTLGDISVAGHLTRLEAGEVTAEQLLDYANNLRFLSRRSAESGRQIPATFWDVDNAAMVADGWTSYRVVSALASESGQPYLDALSAAYARFHAFKMREAGSEDTAVDTALDLVAPIYAFVPKIPADHRLETSPYITNDAQAALYLWQQVLVGSTRTNPLTRVQIFNHGFTRRFHLGTIWQYDTGTGQNNSAIWGLSGFEDRFIGDPENNTNQIEHMSISMVVQGILREPVLILEAFEEFERLAGEANRATADADEALNAAVAEHFVPGFETDLVAATERLRAALKAP
ncbi:hypothetical protein [Pseudoruegeria sp. SHC-113]|uniref:hypothetical protein n=1 Tax=Pseudoruegeria sp. SHC-113 TaxID=2855439 RepID=UPI0021BA4FF9|nr:hypothetical protein [Pseudoruegeria sp. SHC-113]MCT8162089.1 hypothetical protein [Pseudoruegeria sp. SHC-113]